MRTTGKRILGQVTNHDDIADNDTEMRIVDVLYADDMQIFASTRAELQKMVDIFDKHATAYGQKVSVKKSEVMVVRERGTACPDARITVKDKTLKVVDSFVYLGSMETAWNSMDEEIARRCGKMRTGFA